MLFSSLACCYQGRHNPQDRFGLVFNALCKLVIIYVSCQMHQQPPEQLALASASSHNGSSHHSSRPQQLKGCLPVRQMICHRCMQEQYLAACMTVLSWTLLKAPMRMEFRSPLKTQPYQIDVCIPLLATLDTASDKLS